MRLGLAFFIRTEMQPLATTCFLHICLGVY